MFLFFYIASAARDCKSFHFFKHWKQFDIDSIALQAIFRCTRKDPNNIPPDIV